LIVNRLLNDDFKEQVRSRTDLLSLVGESVALRPQRGGRDYVGLCPFHEDHNPSMHVYTDRQSFRCWVCDAGGDCFSFVMLRDRVEFREALELLANRAGLEMPKQLRPGPTGPTVDAKQKMYQVVAWAEQQFHEFLLESPTALRARKYLRDRGISDESMVRFRLGYHPDEWEWLIGRARGKYTIADLAGVKLVKEREGRGGWYDCFVDRVLFPIRDAQRRPVAFGGRVLPDSRYADGPKYLNTDEYPLFLKSKLVYGLDEARETISKSDTVVVTEGYTDCIMAHQFGLKNVVGTLGTALNDNHVSLLKRFARRVILLFDGDVAGQKATERALVKFLSQEIDLRTLTLPGGQDPADFLMAQGAEALRALLTQSVEAWEYKYRLVVERYGVDSIDSRHRILQEMLEILLEVPAAEGAGLAAKWREREQIILGRLAQRLKVGEAFIRDRLRDLRTARQQRGETSRPVELPGGNRPGGTTAPAATAAPMIPPLPKLPTRDEQAELDLLLALFAHPEQAELAAREVSPAEFQHVGLRRLYELCLMTLARGQSPSFERLTLQIEDLALSRLAVEVDERARQASPSPDLLRHLLEYYRRKRELEMHSTEPVHELAEEPIAAVPGPATPEALDEMAKQRLRRAMKLHASRARRPSGMAQPGETNDAHV
jgi:DNA primase